MSKGIVHWTNCNRLYQGRGEVSKVNSKTLWVRLLEEVPSQTDSDWQPYPIGTEILVPINGTPNNCFVETEQVKAKTFAELDQADMRRFQAKFIEADQKLQAIVPPIKKQHDVAKRIAREHMFDPREAAFAKCVGAIMQAWQPGKIWDEDE